MGADVANAVVVPSTRQTISAGHCTIPGSDTGVNQPRRPRNAWAGFPIEWKNTGSPLKDREFNL